MSRYTDTKRIIDLMDESNVSLTEIEVASFLDLFEDNLIVTREAAFDLLSEGFEGAYSKGNVLWWENLAERTREALEDAGALGEYPNDIEDQYAMHFGIPFRQLSEGELRDANAAVRRFGGSAYCDGDNFAEWGEPLMSAEDAANYGRPEDHIAYQSGHLVIYINKGIEPLVVFEEVKAALPLVSFLPVEDRWSYKGRPFIVDEADEWGANVNTAHEIPKPVVFNHETNININLYGSIA